MVEKYPELKQQFELARTDSEQMKKDLKEGLISQWYTRHDLNVWPSVPETDALSSWATGAYSVILSYFR